MQEFVNCKEFIYDLVTRIEGKEENFGDLLDVIVILKFILNN
jgi:hypothetical protein